MIRFLIDECLTPYLAIVSKIEGYEGEHVNHLRLDGQPDRSIALTAIMREDILVTNNARDLRRIYAGLASHPGLLIILPSVPRREQMSLFRQAIAFIEAQPQIVDQMVVVRRDRTITIEPWPRRAE